MGLTIRSKHRADGGALKAERRNIKPYSYVQANFELITEKFPFIKNSPIESRGV